MTILGWGVSAAHRFDCSNSSPKKISKQHHKHFSRDQKRMGDHKGGLLGILRPVDVCSTNSSVKGASMAILE